MTKKALLPLSLVALAGTAQGQAIITEVFYNPSGQEAETEWVEITNVGATPVDISRYALDDEDGSTPSHMFGAGLVRNTDGTILDVSADIDCLDVPLNQNGGIVCDPDKAIILAPGESIVIGGFWDSRNTTNGENGRDNTIEAFVSSWGEDTDGDMIGDTLDYRVILLLSNATIANTASATNEVLELVEISTDNLIISRDLANYQVGNSSNQWPFSSNGRSIYLQPNFYADAASTELIGEAWALSETGRDGGQEGRLVVAIDADDEAEYNLYGEGDVASPGFAPQLVQSFEDANNNGRDDALDIFLGTSLDCNRNRIPDEAEPDCNGNGIPDGCEFQINQEDDCDGDGQPDDCQISNDPSLDLNSNGLLDSCEALIGFENVVITEIMFNPSGSESEWIEIVNTGDTPVDVAGWFFQDLDQPAFDAPEAPFAPLDDTDGDGEADALILQPGEILVAGDETLEDWEAGWGPVTGYRYIQAPINISNNADLVNEVRTLLAPVVTGTDPVTMEDIITNVRIDVANLQSTTSNGVPQGGWPGDDGRGSLFAFAPGVDADGNNNPNNWGLSIRSVDGARSPMVTDRFDGRDAGSPGVINTGAPVRPAGDVIISEIHFSTNSDFPGLPFPDETNGIDEWVEIVNISGSTIDIGGWWLEDEDGRTDAIPAGTILAAGEAAVLSGWDFLAENPTPVTEYYAAWNCGFQVIPLNNWYDDGNGPGLDRLGDAAEGGTGTNPSTGREILTLRTANDVVQDVVNYDDDGFVWPQVSNGLPFNFAFSIYLFNSSDYNELDNDSGLNWATSLAGFDGAIQNNTTTIYNAPAFGSPGFVDGITTNFDPNNCISSDPVRPLCADQNDDGEIDGLDFGAWLGNFNAGNPQADVNQDDAVNGLDFGAWLGAFNAGQDGPICE